MSLLVLKEQLQKITGGNVNKESIVAFLDANQEDIAMIECDDIVSLWKIHGSKHDLTTEVQGRAAAMSESVSCRTKLEWVPLLERSLSNTEENENENYTNVLLTVKNVSHDSMSSVERKRIKVADLSEVMGNQFRRLEANMRTGNSKIMAKARIIDVDPVQQSVKLTQPLSLRGSREILLRSVVKIPSCLYVGQIVTYEEDDSGSACMTSGAAYPLQPIKWKPSYACDVLVVHLASQRLSKQILLSLAAWKAQEKVATAIILLPNPHVLPTETFLEDEDGLKQV